MACRYNKNVNTDFSKTDEIHKAALQTGCRGIPETRTTEICFKFWFQTRQAFWSRETFFVLVKSEELQRSTVWVEAILGEF